MKTARRIWEKTLVETKTNRMTIGVKRKAVFCMFDIHLPYWPIKFSRLEQIALTCLCLKIPKAFQMSSLSQWWGAQSRVKIRPEWHNVREPNRAVKCRLPATMLNWASVSCTAQSWPPSPPLQSSDQPQTHATPEAFVQVKMKIYYEVNKDREKTNVDVS